MRSVSFVLVSPLFLVGCPDQGVQVHNADPRAEITSHADGDSPEAGLRTFTGTVEDPDHDADELELAWQLDGVEACPPVFPDASGNTSCEIFLESGDRTVTLQVEDHLGGIASDKVSLDVQPYGEPWAEVSAPVAGNVYYSDQLIDFIGVVGDEADAPAELAVWWESGGEALDVLATPDSSGNVIGSGYLEQGDHQLVLKVQNTGGNEAFDAVTIQVGAPNSAPSCSITFPEDGSSGPYGDPVALTAEVSDPDVPADWLEVSWESDHDGELGSSSPSSSGEVAFATTLSSIATHTITMRVEDELGATCSDFVQYTVEDCSVTWYADNDGDGYGDPGVTTTGCEPPSGHVADSSDCDDSDATINPAVTEVCNSLDDDCDGDIDDDDSGLDSSTGSTWYADSDGDGYGDATSSTLACAQPSGHAADPTDCDDGNAATHPGADEYCDGVDSDCDGTLDEHDAVDASSWYADTDGDGFGDPLSPQHACTAPSGHVADSSDCDDGSADIHPGADEYCDGVDTDCDGAADEDEALDASDWYADSDGDGYGDASTSSSACSVPSGSVGDSTDCDDGDTAVNPGATEACNGHDDDCDALVDDDDPGIVGTATWYADRDGDGYGDPLSTAHACTAPSGHVADDTDCDDTSGAINPAASEICNSVDDDCDGLVDGHDSGVTGGSSWYVDADGDGFGDAASSTSACVQPSGYVAGSSDCDDGDANVFPGADEYCNGSDDDCDGSVDEADAVDMPLWFIDYDGDGYGSMALMREQCSQPAGYADNADDCDDASASISPSANEYCNSVDDDCDGTTDEPDAVDARAWYQDRDGDGYGDATVTQPSCSAPGGYVSSGTDCDDADTSVSPAASEYCDGVDNDCDGVVDEDEALDTADWYLDSDMDGYGDASSASASCEAPSGYIWDATDCDDDDALIFPGAEDVCHDGVDQDCDGTDNDCRHSGSSGIDELGFRIVGEAAGDGAGRTVTFPGDVDGDGFTDVFIGARGDDDGGSDAGAAYLVYGPVTGDLSLVDADSKMIGEVSGDRAGGAISGAGDLDEDGFADLLIGASNYDGASGDEGAVYLVYGPATGDIDLSLADVFLVGEAASDYAGCAISAAGDVSGDGVDDIIVGANQADSAGTNSGSAYVLFGPLSTSGDLSLADVHLSGEDAFDQAGLNVAGVGDVDGDGIGDLMVGANGADGSYENEGCAYLVYGPVSGDLSLSAADGKFTGEGAFNYAGCSIAGAGDVNADGYADILVGAYGVDDGGTDAGAAYLVLGPATVDGVLSVADVQFTGEDDGDYAGYKVSSAGDLDADGFSDILIGAYLSDEGGTWSGASYVVYGPVTGDLDLGAADLRLVGEDANDQAGFALAGGADVNGDGYDDVLVGALGNDEAGSNAGAAYLIFGGGL